MIAHITNKLQKCYQQLISVLCTVTCMLQSERFGLTSHVLNAETTLAKSKRLVLLTAVDVYQVRANGTLLARRSLGNPPIEP